MKIDKNLMFEIEEDPLLEKWLGKAYDLLEKGANAGTHYPEVWIRDFATFIEVGMEVNDPQQYRELLIRFFYFQSEEGGIIDGYTEKGSSLHDYNFIYSEDYPQLAGHKNTVEADQEASLVDAIYAYLNKTKDFDFLKIVVNGLSIFDRLELAMKYVLKHRWSDQYQLVWNATTIDWGDLQPETEWGVEMDEHSHPAICIYTNALFLNALNRFAVICELRGSENDFWVKLSKSLKENIRKYLWDEEKMKFIPHLYLKGSPFPEEFNENEIYYHGGTACAILADVLTLDEVEKSLQWMQINRSEAKAQTIGLTIWPLYSVESVPSKFFKEPFYYQNGGDWPWFGGRMIRGLIRYGLIAEAYEELLLILKMIDRAGDFNEWFSPSGEPKGAFQFRGAAGVLGLAIIELKKAIRK